MIRETGLVTEGDIEDTVSMDSPEEWRNLAVRLLQEREAYRSVAILHILGIINIPGSERPLTELYVDDEAKRILEKG